MKVRMIPRRSRIPGVIVGVALLASSAHTQETKTVTGTATYRERIALPPDAVFEATLEDAGALGALPARGMSRYMADAATFTDCQSGQRWPVGTEEDYKALEAAYLKTRRQPPDELLVTLERQVVMRPNPDNRQPSPTLVVDRYIGIWPGETCGAPSAIAPLQERYWKLMRLEDKPVILAEKQREPSLTLRTRRSRVTGFGGSLRGAFESARKSPRMEDYRAASRALRCGRQPRGAIRGASTEVKNV